MLKGKRELGRGKAGALFAKLCSCRAVQRCYVGSGYLSRARGLTLSFLDPASLAAKNGGGGQAWPMMLSPGFFLSGSLPGEERALWVQG